MQKSIFSLLPDEIIREILVYDRRFIWRENRLIFISRFSKKDERYSLLKKIPRKWNLSENTWSVILCLENKKRFVLGYRNVVNNEWQYFFSVFSYNRLMKEMREYSDIDLCYRLL
jgi:hypothetical protein